MQASNEIHDNTTVHSLPTRHCDAATTAITITAVASEPKDDDN